MTSDQAKDALRLQKLLEIIEEYVTEPVAQAVADELSDGITPTLEGIKEILDEKIYHQLFAVEQCLRDFEERLRKIEEKLGI